MTPFGARVRELRAQRNVTLSDMAAALDVSPAYLSALEHGRRGRPTFALVQSVIAYFNVIWDEAEELQRLAALSHPRITIDTSGLSPAATRLANRLARDCHKLDDKTISSMEKLLDDALETGAVKSGKPGSGSVPKGYTG